MADFSGTASPLDFAGIQTQQRITRVAAEILRICPGSAGDLAAFACFHFNIMHDRADRHGGERHGVAGFHVDFVAGHHNVARRESLRRENIGECAILVFDQCNE